MTFNRQRELTRVESALDERHHLIEQKALKLINRSVPAMGGNFGYVHRMVLIRLGMFSWSAYARKQPRGNRPYRIQNK